MGEVDISEMKVKDMRSLGEAYEELGLTKGRVAILMREGKLDYGMRGNVKLVPEEAIQRRLRENPGPGNPGFGTGEYARKPPEGCMTTKEAAAAIGVSEGRVRQLIDEGTLKTRLHNGLHWITAESVARRVENGPAKPWSKAKRGK